MVSALRFGCVLQTLLEWVKRVEVDTGVREDLTTSEARRAKELEHEVRELRRATRRPLPQTDCNSVTLSVSALKMSVVC
jgi:transposase-like protein